MRERVVRSIARTLRVPVTITEPATPRRADVDLNGRNPLGVCELSEVTFGRRQMLRAVDSDGREYLFNASSVYLISYLADGQESWADAAADAGKRIWQAKHDPWAADQDDESDYDRIGYDDQEAPF